ncbi:uncharacterized protein EV420DRAFT_1562921 [Desarmillaria tabescens]|uniref:Uncharacterized protein n=1 Tax=Armillaria tabescens TaxID=1929756 RepID=A0AA39MXZ0_ARMTA|nr:uncharacterized protein EV420DRAFT_1562921 [Desarmillaria tabescens]KAK0450318.1 hypothetical protein EV420DRAFT_1562921 [Desarmillaria tabescens]
MTEGQSMSGPGDFRKNFFKDVVDAATKEKHSGIAEVEKAYQDLEDAIYSNSDLSRGSTTSLPLPKIYIMWDEAHYLEKGLLRRESISGFSILEHGKKISFSFFVSLSGRIAPAAPPRSVDSSTRIHEGTLESVPPFTDLGFDQLMSGRQVGRIGAQTLADVTKLEYVVHMGRPLWGGRYDVGDKHVKNSIFDFAHEKLLCQKRWDFKGIKLSLQQTFACLSQRLALELDSRTRAALLEEKNLIENHMRVCLETGTGLDGLLTASSSEPILSEVSSLTTRWCKDNFSMAEALKMVLSYFPIRQEHHGALLVLVLFTIARDSAIPRDHEYSKDIFIVPVLSFFEQLFTEDISDMLPSRVGSAHESRTFKEEFSRASLHFNHCIKPQNTGALNRSTLLGFIARGAAIVHHAGVDMTIPFLFYDLELIKWNVGFILAKVDHQAMPRARLFDTMDPFVLGLFEDGEPTVPIIRIIFALGVPTEKAKLVRMPPYMQGDFTSYDFWCAGMSPEIVKPGVSATSWTWDALLAASCGRARDSDSQSAEGSACRRQQEPLVGMDKEHWNQFVDFTALDEGKAEDYLKDRH